MIPSILIFQYFEKNITNLKNIPKAFQTGWHSVECSNIHQNYFIKYSVQFEINPLQIIENNENNNKKD